MKDETQEPPAILAEMRKQEPDEGSEPLPAASCGGTTQEQEQQPRRKESNEKKTESDANVSLPRRDAPAGDSDSAAEPLAAIVREMRDLGKLDEKSTDKIPRRLMGLGLRTYADRIEAAVKRELSRAAEDAASKATLDRTAKDAVEYMVYAMANSAPPPGNAAALREALEEQLRYWNAHVRSRDEEEMRKRTEAALAAPRRNCDVGTAKEQYRRFMTMCNSKDATQCSTCMFRQSCYTSRDKCFARWAQVPYAKREGGTDEQK